MFFTLHYWPTPKEEEQLTAEEQLTVEEQFWADYDKMFLGNDVPNYPSIGEEFAPEPLIYLIADKDGEIVHARRLKGGSRSWQFEEIELEAISGRELGWRIHRSYWLPKETCQRPSSIRQRLIM